MESVRNGLLFILNVLWSFIVRVLLCDICHNDHFFLSLDRVFLSLHCLLTCKKPFEHGMCNCFFFGCWRAGGGGSGGSRGEGRLWHNQSRQNTAVSVVLAVVLAVVLSHSVILVLLIHVQHLLVVTIDNRGGFYNLPCRLEREGEERERERERGRRERVCKYE